MSKMKDKDLRDLTLRYLNKEHENETQTKIINEMGLVNGASRVDIAVINGVLHGYELKSESDNLNRLPRQVENYNRIFERMTIIIDRKFIDEVKKIIPSWWGIMIVKKNKSGLIQIRKGRKINTQDQQMLLNLLWKSEYDDLIDILDYPKSYKRKAKDEIFKLVSKDKRKSTIKKYIYSTLKNRNYS